MFGRVASFHASVATVNEIGSSAVNVLSVNVPEGFPMQFVQAPLSKHLNLPKFEL
jgi:hypothetical protein